MKSGILNGTVWQRSKLYDFMSSITCSPDPATNYENTNLNFHDFFDQLDFTGLLGLFVIVI